jgi:hypothetical protein
VSFGCASTQRRFFVDSEERTTVTEGERAPPVQEEVADDEDEEDEKEDVEKPDVKCEKPVLERRDEEDED